jgi:hypothetical protein
MTFAAMQEAWVQILLVEASIQSSLHHQPEAWAQILLVEASIQSSLHHQPEAGV